MEPRGEGRRGRRDVKLRADAASTRSDEVAPVAFPYFGGIAHEHFQHNDQGGDVLVRNVPVKKLQLADGEALVATVFDLLLRELRRRPRLGGGNVARSYDDDVPYTPAWQEAITGVQARRT